MRHHVDGVEDRCHGHDICTISTGRTRLGDPRATIVRPLVPRADGQGGAFSVGHYTEAVTELVLLEPNPHFRRVLRDEVATAAPAAVQVIDGDVHDLGFPDRSFDTVTASLVFCSVTDPVRALREVHRVLRPGGRFLFHEHVRGHGARALLQDLLTPLQRRLADGCHANRDFERLLLGSPLELDELVRTRMPTSLPTIVPLVVGAARRVD